MKNFEQFNENNIDNKTPLSINEIKNKINTDIDYKIFDEVCEDIKITRDSWGVDHPKYRDLIKTWHEHYRSYIKERNQK